MESYNVNFSGKKVLYTDIQAPWKFKTSDKKDYPVNLSLEKCEYSKGAVSFSLYHYKNTTGDISAVRMCFSDDNNIVFFLDVINSERDVCVYTDFTAGNSDLSVTCNIADKNKLVIRNKDCGIKHFKLHSEIDGESILDKSGLMMPVKVKENGDIIYSMYDGLYSFGKNHINCFGITCDLLDQIIYWHLNKTEKGYIAEPPSKNGGLEIEILSDCVNLYEVSKGECIMNVKM